MPLEFLAWNFSPHDFLRTLVTVVLINIFAIIIRLQGWNKKKVEKIKKKKEIVNNRKRKEKKRKKKETTRNTKKLIKIWNFHG